MSLYQKNWGSRGRHSRKDYFNRKRQKLFASGRRQRKFNFAQTSRRSRSWFKRVFWPFDLFRGKSFIKTLLKLVGAGFVLLLLLGLAAFAYYSKDIPDPNSIVIRTPAESTKIYDRNGELLYDIFGEAKRTIIPFEKMPDNIKQATIAIEDKDFYKHKGLDYSRIISSIIIDIVTLSKAQGASTITQQFVRNALLTREKVFSRKIKEIVLAIQIERKFTKDEILEFYLNEVPYGSNAYGIEAAAQTYFEKPAAELTLAEAAYLAALPQAPSLLSPTGPNRDRLDARKNAVLKAMEEQGYITKEEREAAQNEKVVFSPVRNAIKAPHFVLYVQGLLAQKYGERTLQEGGLQVTTTLDLRLQKIAEEAIAERAETNEKNYNAKNAALLALDPKTGQILAMVGSRNFFEEENDGQVNVTLRPRQPGSSFKPYVYATAFKKGFTPATMLMDVVTNFGNFGGEDYIPRNYNDKTYGPVSIRKALAGSLNIPAVKTILLVGVKDSIDTARDMGITTLQDRSRYGPSLVLGGGEVKLIDHVSAFGVFATNGIRHQPVPILRVTDAKGKVLEEYKEKSGQKVLDEQVAYLINSILSDNNARAFAFGARNYLTLADRPVAAKTGTTQEFRDAWTLGYTPQLVAGVWVGNNDNSPMRAGAAGGVVAAPIWNSFMKKALAGLPVENFTRPPGIQEIRVDTVSGKLPTQYTPQTRLEVFASFAVPTEYDDVHIPIKIDKTTFKPATPDTPQENIVTRVFTVLHSLKPNDENWEEPVRQWALQNGFAYPGINQDNAEATSFTLAVLEPGEGKIINSLPLTISATALPAAQTKRIRVYLDDQEIFNTKESSFTFFYSQARPDGEYTLRVEAEAVNGNKVEETKTINYQLGQELTLSKPLPNTTLTFPVVLIARAKSSVSNVEFFFQKPGAVPVRISGASQKVPEENGNGTEFRLVWTSDEMPEPGEYELYAQSNTGEKSEKVKIIIP